MIVRSQAEFHCDPETYFKELFNYDARKRRETEGRGALSFEVRESHTEGSEWSHKVAFEEKVDAPAPVRKLLGETTVVEEEMKWRPGEKVAHVTYSPSTLGDKTHISGTLKADPTGDGHSKVTMETELRIKVFAVGKVMEKVAADKLRKDFKKDVDYFNRVLAKEID